MDADEPALDPDAERAGDHYINAEIFQTFGDYRNMTTSKTSATSQALERGEPEAMETKDVKKTEKEPLVEVPSRGESLGIYTGLEEKRDWIYGSEADPGKEA